MGRGDLYTIANDIEFLKVKLARLPRRKGLVRMALGIIFRSAALALIARGVARLGIAPPSVVREDRGYVITPDWSSPNLASSKGRAIYETGNRTAADALGRAFPARTAGRARLPSTIIFPLLRRPFEAATRIFRLGHWPVDIFDWKRAATSDWQGEGLASV